MHVQMQFQIILTHHYLIAVRAWYCNLTHGTHPVTEPNEIPIMGIDDIINRPLQPSLSGFCHDLLFFNNKGSLHFAPS